MCIYSQLRQFTFQGTAGNSTESYPAIKDGLCISWAVHALQPQPVLYLQDSCPVQAHQTAAAPPRTQSQIPGWQSRRPPSAWAARVEALVAAQRCIRYVRNQYETKRSIDFSYLGRA